MKCNNCHVNIPDDSLFCPFCGKKVETPSIPDQRPISGSNYHELQVRFTSDLVGIVNDYNGLTSEQKARFFPGQHYQARKVVHSFLYLLGQDCDYSRLLELYITIASRAMMGFDTERIGITVKARFSDILPENKAATLIECAKRIYSNYAFLSKANTPEYTAYEKQFDQEYRSSLAEHEKHNDDAIKLPNYGTSISNPIYAHAAAGSYRYLNLLYTSDLIPLTWNRVRSVTLNNVKDPLDQYELLLPDGSKTKTVYVNMYSRKSSCYCPKGLFGDGLKELGGETAPLLQPPAKEQRSTPKTREENKKQGAGEKTEERRENNRGKNETRAIANSTPVLSEELLSEKTTSVLQGNLPVLLVKKAIRKRSDGQVSAVCIFQPVTMTPIRAMQVDVLCYDVWHEQVQSVERFQYNDLKTSRDSNFGADTVIPLPDPNTREIDVVVQRMMLADGMLIQRTNDNIELPALETIDAFLGDAELVSEYKKVTSTYRTTKFLPVKLGAFWRCSCGAINHSEDSVCHICRVSEETLFKHLDKETLQSSIEEEKRLQREKEEQERIAREKEEERRRELSRIEAAEAYAREEERRRKNKKRVRICAAIGSLAFAAYVVWSLIIPVIQYKKADELLAAGDRETAYATFLRIARYGDSYNRACAIRYEDAEAAFNAGDYTGAALLYESISGYLDSNDLGIKCRKEQTYTDAMAQFEKENYKKAGELFESLKPFKNSTSMMLQAYYLYAKELIESGDLHGGYEVLSAKVNRVGSGYEDSVELANTSEYQYAADCFAEEKYAAAAESFANLTDYEDSAARALESNYQYGLALLSSGKFVDAETVFTDLGDYKDSAKQLNESIYQHGLALMEAGKYDEAITALSRLTNYRDSANQLKEAKYQKALLLMSKKKYQEAEILFEELGYYRDSTTQLNEAKYQRAMGLATVLKYTEAVSLFKELGNYSDSVEQWKTNMWLYVLKHKNNDDQTTFEYLTVLRKYNYQDSKKFYEDLYTWRATAEFYTSDSATTRVTSISKNQGYVMISWTISGGAPGEKITVYQFDTWPNGGQASQISKELVDGGVYRIHWDSFYGYDKTGTFTSKLYNKNTNAIIGTATLKIY